MALDARRRQKKAEKRKAKEKEKRREFARRKTEDMGQKLAHVAAAPILHCLTTQDLWDGGIAQVLVSRELANGFVAFATFLVDRYCLGVKDAFGGFMAKSEYLERFYDRISREFEIVALKPAAARKLVEEAVEYAKGLGLSPHPDYARARQIFGDIDPAASDREFEFGKDGKPFFVAGPHDSPGRCASVVGLLEEHCGKGEFDYLVGVPGSMLVGAGDGPEWDDGYEEEIEEEAGATIEGSSEPKSAPTLPVRMAASLRRMIFGDE